MGKGRDKKKRAAQKAGKVVHGKGSAKTESKTGKNDKKKKKREMFRDGKGGDDVETILAGILADGAGGEGEGAGEAALEPCEPPPPRVNFTLTTVGSENRLEMVLFGGERNDGRQVQFFRELYRYSLWNNRWWRVRPAGLEPGPRSGHAAAMWKQQMFVFGGEFSNPNATQFHHYRDLWHLNLEDNEWEKVDGRGRAPTARSGHRMQTHSGRLFLFGGFSDFVKESKYYNDLFVFDIENLMWNEVNFGVGALRPPPRSGFQWLVDGGSLLLFGGYYKQNKHKKLYDSSKSAGGKRLGPTNARPLLWRLYSIEDRRCVLCRRTGRPWGGRHGVQRRVAPGRGELPLGSGAVQGSTAHATLRLQYRALEADASSVRWCV